ncbi:MAG: FRG domain-containing protein [Acholeplasmataceae bacterium]|nr:FRG domain-containing protein [Acholeplasmataceae bacterium]
MNEPYNNILGILKTIKRTLRGTLGHQYIIFAFHNLPIEKIIAYFNEYKEYIWKSLSNLTYKGSEKIHDINEFEELFFQTNSYNQISDLEEIMKYSIWIHCVDIINRYTTYRKTTIENYQDLIEKISDRDIKRNDNQKVPKYWFRGQANADWEILPSFYRGMEKNSVLVDFNYIDNDYSAKRLSQKYDEIFMRNHINYEMLAFIQHSIGYSPLIDFTKESLVALTFALDDFKHISNFYHSDSVVIRLDTANEDVIRNEIDADHILNNLQVFAINNPIHITTIMRSKLWTSMLTSPTMQIHFIDIPTNDRMRYQRGTFVLFDKFVVVGNHPLIPTHLASRFEFFIIPRVRNIKENIYARNYNINMIYRLQYLMDPYLYITQG